MLANNWATFVRKSVTNNLTNIAQSGYTGSNVCMAMLYYQHKQLSCASHPDDIKKVVGFIILSKIIQLPIL